MTESTPSRIDSLQILRFVAALLVVVGHAQHEFVAMPGLTPGGYDFVPFDWGLGVDIFFVISGFVMFYLMHDRFGADGAAGDFLRRRIIRIVPLYWLFTTLVLAIALRGGEALPSINILFSYLFLPGPACGEYCFPVFSLGWTLNYEMLFYLVFAVGLTLRRPYGLAAIVSAITALMAMGQIIPTGATMLHFWGYPIIGEFLFGIAIAWAFLRGTRMSATLGWALVAAGFALAILAYQLQAYEAIWRLWTGGVPAAMIVAGAVLGCEPRRGGRAVALLVLGGDASYALYLVHPFAVKAIAATGGHALIAVSPILFLASAVITAIVASLAVHQLIERPVLHRLKRRWRGKAARTSRPLLAAGGK